MSVTYLAFQLVRFTMPLMSPSRRWALTPPFHLFPVRFAIGQGSLFSVALSVGVFLGATFLLGSTMLCVARTFLLDLDKYRDRDDKPACSAKLRIEPESVRFLMNVGIGEF